MHNCLPFMLLSDYRVSQRKVLFQKEMSDILILFHYIKPFALLSQSAEKMFSNQSRANWKPIMEARCVIYLQIISAILTVDVLA